VIQTVTVPAPTPPVSQSFEGLGNGQYGFSVTGAPPDTNGTVGATQYVQWVNTSFAIFNKSNGALMAGPTAGNTLWSGFGGGCQTNNDGDPIVVYDKLGLQSVLGFDDSLPSVHCRLDNFRRNRNLQPLLFPVLELRRLSQDVGLARRVLRNV